MGYEFHVFLSYRRHGEWPTWVREKFMPLFIHWLGEELGEEAQVFFDQTIETGTSWPHALGTSLARSRVLVPLWSRMYFSSNWCVTELAHMRMREEYGGFRTAERPYGLIIPALIHDGNDLPASIRDITPAHLQECANVRLAKDSAMEEELSNRIRNWVPDIAQAIRRAPEYTPQWNRLGVESFIKELKANPPRQSLPPTL
jgi:hypothetical protein